MAAGKKYVLHIYKTNFYPYYLKTKEVFDTLAEAENRMNEVSKELNNWQDYNLEIRLE